MKNKDGYLFVYFTGEQEKGEQIYFSISKDGLHWKDINHCRPVLESRVGEKGVRDPFIIRSADGSRYYIIATDLRIASNKGWDVAQYEGSRSIVIWESEDLIHWSQERLVEVGLPEAGCVWAPEAIYNEKTDDYLVFWASMVKVNEQKAKQRIYYAVTKDFQTFSKTQLYIERENHIIDTTIIKDQDWYYYISKDETTKNIKIVRNQDLLDLERIPVNAPALESILGVEGPEAYRINGTNKWCLIIDHFATSGGYRPLITENLAKGEFEVLQPDSYDMGETKKRHGSILNINEVEMKRLVEQYKHN